MISAVFAVSERRPRGARRVCCAPVAEEECALRVQTQDRSAAIIKCMARVIGGLSVVVETTETRAAARMCRVCGVCVMLFVREWSRAEVGRHTISLKSSHATTTIQPHAVMSIYLLGRDYYDMVAGWLGHGVCAQITINAKINRETSSTGTLRTRHEPYDQRAIRCAM